MISDKIVENESRELIQRQFGLNPDSYATSPVHAKGASLNRLIDAIELKPEWYVLDIATGAGHTAHTLAPYVRRVVASDLTFGMLKTTMRLASSKGLINLDMCSATADQLPYRAESFDLVMCRIAAHHFPSIQAFMADSIRVLQSGGLLAVIDNIVPGSVHSRKKTSRLEDVGRYLNAFEKLRDPSHARTLSQDEWFEAYYQNGVRIVHHETIEKQLDLDSWAQRMMVSDDNLTRLKSMVRQAPSRALDYLKPQYLGERILFNLTEIILIGIKER